MVFNCVGVVRFCYLLGVFGGLVWIDGIEWFSGWIGFDLFCRVLI